MVNQSSQHIVQVLNWEGVGFRPLVTCGDWTVALMNWEQRFDLSGIGDLERHNETDEVFVVTKGNGILFIANEDGIRVFDMQPGIIYNVTRSTWHSVIGTRQTTWLIVESKNTTKYNTDHRALSENELAALKEQFPVWLK
jgi:mannose-6-phosphate isomerase-like protein (cupin superfamily)